MSKLKLKARLYTLLFIFIGVAGIGIWGTLISFFPTLFFDYYLLVPLFFALLGIGFIAYITRIKVPNEQRLFAVMSLIRGVKLVATVAFGALFWMLNKTEMKSFIMMLTLFYLLYLFFETLSFVQFEKWRKENNKPIQK